MTDYFAGIAPLAYEGPESGTPLAYRHYNPDEVVMGKRMEDHLRFAACYWHNFVCSMEYHLYRLFVLTIYFTVICAAVSLKKRSYCLQNSALSIYPEILCADHSCRCSLRSHNRFSGQVLNLNQVRRSDLVQIYHTLDERPNGTRRLFSRLHCWMAARPAAALLSQRWSVYP